MKKVFFLLICSFFSLMMVQAEEYSLDNLLTHMKTVISEDIKDFTITAEKSSEKIKVSAQKESWKEDREISLEENKVKFTQNTAIVTEEYLNNQENYEKVVNQATFDEYFEFILVKAICLTKGSSKEDLTNLKKELTEHRDEILRTEKGYTASYQAYEVQKDDDGEETKSGNMIKEITVDLDTFEVSLVGEPPLAPKEEEEDDPKQEEEKTEETKKDEIENPQTGVSLPGLLIPLLIGGVVVLILFCKRDYLMHL